MIPPTQDGLRDLVGSLHMARLNEAAIEGELEVLRAEWDKLAGPVIERRGLAQAATREADERIRAGALNLFQRDGAKDLGFGVAIREITRLKYKNTN